MGTRQTFKTTDVLRLEVEETPAGLVNQIINPPETSLLQFDTTTAGTKGDGWGWVGNESALSAQFFVQVPTGRTDAWVSWAMLNGAPNSFYSEHWAHDAGEYAAARLVGATLNGVTAYVRLRFEWLDAAGVVIGSSPQSDYVFWPRVDTTGGAVQSISAQQAPAGTVRARLRFDLYGDTSGGNPTGGTVYFKEVTAAKAATAAELTGLGYIPAEPTWVDVIGPTHTIKVTRSELNVGTLTAEVLDATIDPSQSTLVRPGKQVRLMALDADTGAWSPLFRGKILKGATTYDPTRTDAKRARVTLTAVDATAQLAGVNKTLGVTTMGHAWRVLEGAHVPFWLNHTQFPASTTYATESKPLLDQVGILRDSELGYVWVSRQGILQLWLGDEIPTTVAATLDESAYADLAIDYDTDRCINVVNVKVRRLDATGQEVEVPYGPYVDQASVDQWNAHSADFTVVGIEDSAAGAAAYAAPILAANAIPQVRINSVDIPIRDATDITAGKALLDLYDLVTVANANAGISENMRPTGLEHSIEDGRWNLHLDFAAEGGVAPPQQSAGLSVPTADSAWHVVGDPGEPGMWAGNVTPLGGWPIKFYKDAAGNTHLTGVVLYSGGNIPAAPGVGVFQLPEGYRPTSGVPHRAIVPIGAQGVNQLEVALDGVVSVWFMVGAASNLCHLNTVFPSG